MFATSRSHLPVRRYVQILYRSTKGYSSRRVPSGRFKIPEASSDTGEVWLRFQLMIEWNTKDDFQNASSPEFPSLPTGNRPYSDPDTETIELRSRLTITFFITNIGR